MTYNCINLPNMSPTGSEYTETTILYKNISFCEMVSQR